MTEYVIINAEAIQKRIEELETIAFELYNLVHDSEASIAFKIRANEFYDVIKREEIKSTRLIPQIEKAFDAGRTVKNYKGEWKETYSDEMTSAKYEESQDYISQLKLYI